jgi:hypothetical protein
MAVVCDSELFVPVTAGPHVTMSAAARFSPWPWFTVHQVSRPADIKSQSSPFRDAVSVCPGLIDIPTASPQAETFVSFVASSFTTALIALPTRWLLLHRRTLSLQSLVIARWYSTTLKNRLTSAWRSTPFGLSFLLPSRSIWCIPVLYNEGSPHRCGVSAPRR